MLPYMKPTNSRQKPKMLYFMGINKRADIREEELADSFNMSASALPALEPRPSREVVATLVSPRALGSGEKRFWVDGTNFVYDGVVKGAVLAGAKSMVDFNGYVLIFPDKKYYDYVLDAFGALGAGVYPVAGSVPDMDYVCVHQNRVFGCKGSEVYASANGQATNWTKFDGDELDSWAGDVYSEGNFTGMYPYQGVIVLTKDDFTYELYGKTPSEFSIVEVAKFGCIDNKSMQEVDGTLYWLSREGFRKYTGGIPRLMDQQLNLPAYSSGAAGTDGRRYFCSLFDGSIYTLYVYDTQNRQWMIEDDLQVVEFTKLNGVCFALASDGKLLQFNSGTEFINWSVTTKNFTDSSFNKKVNGRIRFRMDVAQGASAKVSIRYDKSGAWVSSRVLEPGEFKVHIIELRLKRCDSYQIKVEGWGYAKIYEMEKELFFGSDR